MRRFLAMLVVAAVCGAVFSLGLLVSQARDGAPANSRVSRLLIAASPALAQEVMEFEPVPAESVSALVGRRPRRTTAPAVPPVPPVPAVPSPPGIAADESGDVVRFGSDITIRQGQTVVGDVVAMGGDVTVDGHVEGDVVAMGGDVRLGPTGRVDGQVVTLGGQLHEQPGSYVGGQRVTAGGLPRGWVSGPMFGFLGMVNSGIKAAWAIMKMLLILLIAWGFTQLAPQRTRIALDTVKSEPLKCLGFGLLGWALLIPSLVALALVVAILCITIIGIPLAIAVLFAYAAALLLLGVWGYVVGASVLGERLARQFGRVTSSLTVMAVWGIVALTTIRVVGYLIAGIPMGGAAGGLVGLIAVVLSWVLLTVGAGSLLATQLRRDSLGQWWPGTRAAPQPASAPPAGPGPVAEPYTPPPAPGV